MANWGEYTLTISKDGIVVKEIKYEGMSGNAMMDEAKYWSHRYPRTDGYTIDW